MTLTEAELLERDFPTVFKDGQAGPDVGPGWIKEILRPLCQKLVELGVGPDFAVAQVKEKYGTLRFYVYGATDEQFAAISAAEVESAEVCEECGSREHVTTEGGWLKTLCATCRDER